MAPSRVILMSCGSYNPPTNMHLRMFEIARDHLHRMGTHIVVGAVISPTHDEYAKKELASAEHRCAMLKLATQNSDWIRVSTWETRQNGWTKTRLSLQHHQNLLNSILLDSNDINYNATPEDVDWIPQNVKNSSDHTPIQIKLLCGADLLESFGTPGLWADEDIDAIVGQHGLVVITREGSNPNKFIYDSDILSKYMHNIHIVTEWIPNEVSSTKIRRALKRGESVRYLVQDSVIEYVYKNGIYNAKTVSTIKLELSSKNGNDYLNIQPKYHSAFLTPSPSDVTMTTPSPVEIISIDISECVLKKNFQNSPIFEKTRPPASDDTERMRDKFINVISENGNKLFSSKKITYPGQAKQIIATETGESQIFCQVGLSCISEKSKTDMEIDGKDSNSEIQNSLDSTVETAKIEKIEMYNQSEEIDEADNVVIAKSDQETSDQEKSSNEIIPEDNSEIKLSLVFSIAETNIIDSPVFPMEDNSFSIANNIELKNDNITDLEKVEEIENNAEKELSISKDLQSPLKNDSLSEPNKCNNDLAQNPEHDEQFIDLKDTDKALEESHIEKEGSLAPETSCLTSNYESHADATKEIQNFTDTVKNIPLDKTEVPDRENLEPIIEKSLIQDDNCEKSNAKNDETNGLKKDSFIDEIQPKRDSNIEIDGKYLKSLVNSRKSPKRLKNNPEDDEIYTVRAAEVLETINIQEDAEKLTKVINESSKDISSSTEKLSDFENVIHKKSLNSLSSLKSGGRKRGVLFQGSLDSINVTQSKSSRASTASHQRISKKSKSYEFIKLTEVQPTEIFKIPITDVKDNPESLHQDSTKLKLDSSSIFTNANESYAPQSDEFCSVCCYANDRSSAQVFYTLRSSESSPVEQASTECDICSNCDLPENGEAAVLKTIPAGPGEPVCELCEICGDVAMDEDVVASSRAEKDEDFVDRRLLASRPLPLSLPKRNKGVVRLDARTFENINDDDDDGDHDDDDDEEDNFEIENCGVRHNSSDNLDKVKILRCKSIDEHSTDNTNSNEDEFEIVNCGLDNEPVSLRETSSRYKTKGEDTFKNIIPRDELAISDRSSKKITRAGSLVTRDTVDRSKTKRRYSSVESLPNSRQIVKSIPDKQHYLRSRGTAKGLIGSADNIRPIRSSRSRSLRKSADDVGRGFNSSIDDNEPHRRPLYEHEQAKLDEENKHKPRDGGTIKMILTKHGIQIISDKETAL